MIIQTVTSALPFSDVSLSEQAAPKIGTLHDMCCDIIKVILQEDMKCL